VHAGKTTFAREYLPHVARVMQFINVSESWTVYDNSGTSPVLLERKIRKPSHI
jgi:hypothetical protein